MCEPFERRREGVERVVHRDPTGTDRRRAPQRGAAVATDVQRGSGLLNGLGLERGGPEVEELTGGLDGLLPPEPPAHLDRLVDTRAAAVEVEAGRVPLLAQPARTDAEGEPAAGEDVDRGRGARGDERVAQPDVVDVRAELDPRRARREIGEV